MPPLARQRPLRRVEYERLAELGAFRDERIELVYGCLVEMSPQGREHAFALTRLAQALKASLGDRAEVRAQLPFIAADESEPEPDVAILAPGDYLDEHPSKAFLLVEVADTSLAYDRFTKGPLYAASDVPEYWIVNLVDRVLEVYRRPEGGTYTEITRHARSATVAVPSFEGIAMAVDVFLPA